MKILFLIISICFLGACSSNEKKFTHSHLENTNKSELLGVWVHKDMAYVFEPHRTTFTPVQSIETQQQWMNWKVLEHSEKQFVVEVRRLGFSTKQVVFTKRGECLIVESTVERFCRQKQLID